jgi:prophage DNA circulation protein
MKNTWREKLRPASLGGVDFEVSGDSLHVGRNVVVHEFVQRDKPYIEDLGKKTRRGKIEAWICASNQNGFNPYPQRDALIEVIERGGAATLQLPDFKPMRVHAHDLEVKQTTTANGGLIVLAFDFVEVGEAEFKSTVFEDTRGRVLTSFESVIDSASSEFAEAFSIEGAQGFVYQDAQDMLTQFDRGLNAYGQVRSVAAQLAQNSLSRPDILRDPARLASSIVGVLREVERPDSFLQFQRPPLPSASTRSRQTQLANQQAFIHLVQAVAVAVFVEGTINFEALSNRYASDDTQLRGTPELVTRDEMEALRRQSNEVAHNELLALSALGIYPETQRALMQLSADAVQHMTAEGEHLARTYKTTCCEGTGWHGYMDSVALAYRHYGVLSNDVLELRNEIPNPLFIEPRSEIELLHSIV